MVSLVGSSPHTLTQMLRERDDADLVRVLLDRPDLALPAPTGFAQLAARATTRHSVSGALQQLTAFELWVASATSSLGTFCRDDLAVPGARLVDIDAALDRLVGLGLLWGGDGSLRSVRALSAMAPTLPDLADDVVPTAVPPIPFDVPTQKPSLVTKVAAGSAFEFVRRVDVLLEHCDHRPLRVRRAGGWASRDVRTLAELLDVRTPVATACLQIAEAAGLLGLKSDDHGELCVPTLEFDAWQRCELQDQWLLLVDAWFDRHLVSGSLVVKTVAFAAYGNPDEGRVLSPADVTAWLDWHRPRRPGRSDRQVIDMLDQASWLGITGLDALASFALPPDAGHLARLLPGRVDHVVVQADLTAVAPGPLTAEAAHDLGTLADVESRGGATVYRFSVESLQRARALGWDSATIISILESRSRTPLPQPLRYLVADLDRAGAVAKTAGTWDGKHQHRRPLRGRATAGTDHNVHTRLDEATATAIVASLRSAEEPDDVTGAGDRTGRGSDLVFDTPLIALREAAETQEVVWCGYVDLAGRRTERLVTVQMVDGGLVEARDTKTSEQFTLPLRRITAAHIIRPAT